MSSRATAPWIFLLLVTAGAFDVAYQGSRAVEAVLPDDLLAYNALRAWIDLGDPLTSFALTPSPYFVDLLLELPLAVVSSDFERYAYFLALAYAAGTASALHLVFRALDVARWPSACGSSATIAVYFLVFPQSLVRHLHVSNHTSEVIATLLGLALLLWLTRADTPPRRREYALFFGLVLVNVLSSTFFVATFLAPAAGALAFVALDRARRPRAARLAVLALIAAAMGIYAQAFISTHAWPIRKDVYGQTVMQSGKQLVTVLDHPDRRVALASLVVGLIFAAVLLVRVRAYRVVVVFFVLTVLACAGLPVLRGAFERAYSLRFLQLPALGSAALMTGYVVLRLSPLVDTRPRATRAARALAFVAVVVLLSLFRGPLHELDPRSTTAPMLACLRAPEHAALLEDGLATGLPARFLNASFRGRARAVPNVVVQLERWHPPSLVASQNSTAWFKDGYRHGRRSLSFLMTFQLSTESLTWVRSRIGQPDVVFRCPLPTDWRAGRVPDRMDEEIETWVWTNEESKRRLEDMVLHDNMRGLFASPSDREATIGAKWGMNGGSDASELAGDAWVWRRREGASARVAITRPMFAPAGRYRADFDLTVNGAAAGAAGATVLAFVGAEPVARVGVAASAPSASFEYVSTNAGGAIGGEQTWFAVDAESGAEEVELRAVRLTRLDAAAVDPLRVFK